MKDVICFEVNDWDEYPKFFYEWFDFESDKHEGQNWIKDLDAYAKENRLCIKVVCVDMAVSLVVTAPKSWVKEHIPEFEYEKWASHCIYKYPHPWMNDCIYGQFKGIEPVRDEKYESKRKSLLKDLHMQFTDEERENFKPHNIYGCPSGELFLDWTKENYGAQEWFDGKPYEASKERE